MNIVLFEAGEAEAGCLPNEDERVVHVVKVLKRGLGELFDAGVINGRKGKAKVMEFGEHAMSFTFEATGADEPDLLPIDLIVGLSRPQTMRKILNEATTLGVRSIRFVGTERGEPSYGESKLWSTGEWRRHVLAGVAQAFTTRMPSVTWDGSLEEALDAVGEPDESTDARLLCLDNYEGVKRLGKVQSGDWSLFVALAIGSERGWTGKERDLFRARRWTLVGLGERVLRTETAVVAAVAVVRERMES